MMQDSEILRRTVWLNFDSWNYMSDAGYKIEDSYMKLVVNLINGKAALCGMGGVEILV